MFFEVNKNVIEYTTLLKHFSVLYLEKCNLGSKLLGAPYELNHNLLNNLNMSVAKINFVIYSLYKITEKYTQSVTMITPWIESHFTKQIPTRFGVYISSENTEFYIFVVWFRT